MTGAPKLHHPWVVLGLQALDLPNVSGHDPRQFWAALGPGWGFSFEGLGSRNISVVREATVYLHLRSGQSLGSAHSCC